MRHLFRRHSLFNEFIIIFTLIMILPTAIIASISYSYSVKQIKSQVSGYLTQIVKNTNNELDNLIHDYDFFSRRLSSSKEVMDFLNLPADDYFNAYLFQIWIERNFAKDLLLQKEIVNSFSIVSDNGAEYFSKDIPDRASFAMLKEALPPNGDILAFAYRSPATNAFVVNIGRRIFSDRFYDQTMGTFTIDINKNKLNELWEDVDLKGGYIFIADGNHTIVYHHDSSKIGTSISDFLDVDFTANQNHNFTVNMDNQSFFVAFHTSAYTNWTMFAVIPMENLKQPVDNQLNYVIISTIIVLFFTSIFAYIFILSIIKPVKKLKKMMAEVGQGNWIKVNAPFPNNELGSLMGGFNFMVDKISILVSQVYESELMVKDAELARKTAQLQALQLQINPHFLYNTLGAINAYLLTNQTAPVQKMIDSLGSMLRYAIQNPFEPVRIADEVKHLRNYLVIQKRRQVSMPKIYWDIEPYAEHPILRLVFQPIVENIFQHGFPDGVEAHHAIWIHAAVQKDKLIITIKDNGIGFKITDEDSESVTYTSDMLNKSNFSGVGIINVHNRLQLAYGPDYGLEIFSKKDYGTTVKLMIPHVEQESSVPIQHGRS